jgi:hypothetical protein
VTKAEKPISRRAASPTFRSSGPDDRAGDPSGRQADTDAMEQGSGHDRKPKPVGGDLVLPFLALLYGGYYLYSILGLPFEAQVNGLFIVAVLFLLIAILLARTGRAWASGAVTLRLDSLLEPVPLLPRRISFLLLTLASLLAIRWLGFTLTTVLFMLSSMIVLGTRSWRMLLTVAGATAAGGYVFFIAILDARFRHGPLEQLLGWLF